MKFGIKYIETSPGGLNTCMETSLDRWSTYIGTSLDWWSTYIETSLDRRSTYIGTSLDRWNTYIEKSLNYINRVHRSLLVCNKYIYIITAAGFSQPFDVKIYFRRIRIKISTFNYIQF